MSELLVEDDESAKMMESDSRDLAFSRLALDLAKKGVGQVSPNPLVGCVIVSPEGHVVGQGTYIYEEIIHAEIAALNEAGSSARDGTAYVSLEPHSHHGRTPPCTEALINAGIRRVVAPIEDPNPLVSGSGFETLRRAGIEVVTGILADEARRLNEKFICWHEKRRPFVHLKLAMSLDGRISLNRSVSAALSGDAARSRVHQMRREHDAILIGGNTAVVDDPMLTDRSGLPRRKPLLRVVLDNRLRISEDSNLVKTARELPTVVFTASTDLNRSAALSSHGVEVIHSRDGGRDLGAVLRCLADRDIQSVLVEGGTEVAGAFVDAEMVDKATLMIAPLIIGGTQAPVAIGGTGAASLADAMRLKNIEIDRYADDIEITGYPTVS